MSQKVSPIGFRLGKLQIWNTKMECFGKFFFSYIFLVYKKQQFCNYLKRHFNKNNSILNFIDLKLKDKTIFINCYYMQYKQISKSNDDTFLFFELQKKKCKGNFELITIDLDYILKHWIIAFICFRFYRVNLLHSTTILASWIKLNLENQIPLKIIFKHLEISLNFFFFSKESLWGEKKFLLKGISIICSGRLRGRRNKISTKKGKQLGLMSLQTVNTFIEYDKASAYTQYGKFGIHVYYYYIQHK